MALTKIRPFSEILFSNYTAQTNQDFKWLVLFDRRTPLPYQKIIKAYSKYTNFVALFCDEWDTVIPTAKAYIKENSSEADWILTTRLDNDDALSCKYIDSLHRLVANPYLPAIRPGQNSIY